MDLHEKKNETNTSTATFEFSALKLNDVSIEVYPRSLTVFGEINKTESGEEGGLHCSRVLPQ